MITELKRQGLDRRSLVLEPIGRARLDELEKLVRAALDDSSIPSVRVYRARPTGIRGDDAHLQGLQPAVMDFNHRCELEGIPVSAGYLQTQEGHYLILAGGKKETASLISALRRNGMLAQPPRRP